MKRALKILGLAVLLAALLEVARFNRYLQRVQAIYEEHSGVLSWEESNEVMRYGVDQLPGFEVMSISAIRAVLKARRGEAETWP